jgi:beta-phosphoglucomutase
MRGVLWDLDGTLVDSAEFHWLSWRETMAAEGIAISYQQFLDSFGQKNDRILAEWLRPDPSPDRIRRVGEAKELAYRRLAQERGLTPLPGAAEWIHRLHARGWKQAIASSAPRANIEVMLRVLGVNRDFDAIVGAEDVVTGKPDPEVFLTAAARIGIPPARCVIVEDAAVGIEAARRAGIKSIGVSRAGALDADVVVSTLSELPADVFERLVDEPASSARND